MDNLVYTGPSVQSQDEADLTDDQIQQLLLEAEGRLRGPVVSTTQDLDAASLRIPKLSSGSALEPYVRQGDEIATVDSAQLIDPKQKQLSNSIRSLDVKDSKKVSGFESTLLKPCLVP
jgi:hypothetical protein